MAQFQYATKSGALATLEAADSASALKALKGLSDADPQSGVSLMNPVAPAPQPQNPPAPTNPLVPENPPAPAARVPRYAAGTTPTTPTTPSPLEQARMDLYGSAADRTQLDETGKAKMRSDVRTQFQDYLDAVNMNFNRLITEEKARATGRMGQTRAAAAAGGTLGGSFGEANLNTMERYNTELQAGIEEKRRTTLAEVYGKIDERAQKEIDAAQLARQGKAEAYIKSLEEGQTQAKDDIKNLAATGTKIADIPENRFAQLLKQSGMDALQFDSYYNANLPANMKPITTDHNVKLPNGNAGLLRTTVDPSTGKAEAPKYFDMGVSYEKVYGQYPGGTKEVNGILYGIKQDGSLVPLTKKTTELKDQPTSYQEWTLAGGQTGTGKSYAEFVKGKSGTSFSPSKEEVSAVQRYISTHGDATDAKKAETDSAFFYSVLDKALGTSGFNVQPFKYPFSGL